jgi:hypothetical protein
LEEAVAQSGQKGEPLPDEVRYLAGLQRIQFVFAYPEQNDIVLAGPAEGWMVDEQARVVGVTTGRPVLQLDDLLVALRTAEASRNGGIRCSIEPTEEGYRNLNQLLQQQRASGQPLNPRTLEPAMKEAFGDQKIVIDNVPANSHFARVLVAADYRMKRLAMGLDPSPVPGLTSYVDQIKDRRLSAGTTSPRWWLACNYEPLARTADGLGWELRGPGVKTLTEDSFVAAGQIQGTGSKSPAAERWADLLTKHYAELSVKDTVFGELRNIMDMCIVAALIQREGMLERAGCSLPLLTGQADLVDLNWNAPTSVPAHCSFVRTSRGWTVTASGGVQIESWKVASQHQDSEPLQAVRAKSTPAAGASWWWN